MVFVFVSSVLLMAGLARSDEPGAGVLLRVPRPLRDLLLLPAQNTRLGLLCEFVGAEQPTRLPPPASVHGCLTMRWLERVGMALGAAASRRSSRP
ncbi:MAG: hypothetical protein CFE43_01845 [Burkholderiales bacterium PBB3]|nr:MAG: hypothetical protein CFE43_01845 [Burkholderiales bacterium PBB3]